MKFVMLGFVLVCVFFGIRLCGWLMLICSCQYCCDDRCVVMFLRLLWLLLLLLSFSFMVLGGRLSLLCVMRIWLGRILKNCVSVMIDWLEWFMQVCGLSRWIFLLCRCVFVQKLWKWCLLCSVVLVLWVSWLISQKLVLWCVVVYFVLGLLRLMISLIMMF